MGVRVGTESAFPAGQVALEEAMAEGERLDAEVAVRDRALRRAVHEYATGGDDIVEMWIAAARKVQ